MEIEVAVKFVTNWWVSSSHTNQKLEPLYDLHCCLSLKIPVGRYLINVKDKHLNILRNLTLMIILISFVASNFSMLS